MSLAEGTALNLEKSTFLLFSKGLGRSTLPRALADGFFMRGLLFEFSSSLQNLEECESRKRKIVSRRSLRNPIRVWNGPRARVFAFYPPPIGPCPSVLADVSFYLFCAANS